ncbi:MAG: hypothetical protein P8M80_11435 [Pirellulaceae bacterium]|nr:hypothetical protein [Pirellulaceae bacterium]
MKISNYLAFVCLFCVQLLFPSAVSADEIGFIEKFALAKDRESVLKELIPGTEDYYYFHCLHYQNTEQYEKVETMLKSWIKPSNGSPLRAKQNISGKAREIVNRQMLLTYSRNPEKSLVYLKEYLNLNFNHQRETLAGPSLPSVLDQVLIDRKALTSKALARHPDTRGFEQSAIDWLLDAKLSKGHLYHALARVSIPDHPKLVSLLSGYLSEDVHEFGQLAVHRLLTKQQLLNFANIKPRLMNNGNFVNTYLSKIRPNPDVHFESSKQAQQQQLTELWDFVKRLSPSYNTLKAHVLYHRLLFDRSLGVYDRKRFLDYVKLPREAVYIEAKYHRQREFSSTKINFNQNYKPQTLYPAIGNDEPLIRSYLQHFFLKDQDYKQYEKYIHYGYLKKNFAETKIVNGLGDPVTLSSYISAIDYKNLRNRVDLDFAFTSKQRFSAEDPVSVEVNVKNVEKLIVKVFEINTSNFYRDQRRPVDTNIELDGLLPNKEFTFEYKESPFLRVKRKFEFPGLDNRGVYIIDFIGNRKSSRALIRKGQLRYIDNVTPAGHELTIVDEKNRVVSDASIWMLGSQYQPDKTGRITVPFSTQPGRVPLIISQGGFSDLDSFSHQSEAYALHVGFHVDRESLVKGATAKVIIRPQVTVNGIPVSVKLLDEVMLRMESTDLDGTASSKVIKDLELFEDRESIHEFKVPPRLQGLTLALTAKVRNLSQGKDVSLSSTERFYVNRIDADVKVEDLHLQKVSGEYFLNMLGKTGEQRVGRSVQLSLKHRDFKDAVNLPLQTSMSGRIKLGTLKGIVSLTVTGPEGTRRQWDLQRLGNSYNSSLFAVEGEVIEVPFSEDDVNLGHQNVALMEMRGGTFIRDLFDHVNLGNGMLTISKLKRGDYLLVLKNKRSINLKVTSGKKVANQVVNQHRQLELKQQKPIQIKSVNRKLDKTVVQLVNSDEFSRVHVVATRYVPRFDIFGQLALNELEPGLTMLPQSQSLYLAGRKIGDEYQYILDRKYAEKYPGIMLKRPGLLLQPWAVRSTQTSRQSAKTGTDFGASDDSVDSASRRAAKKAKELVGNTDESSLDFLPSGSIVLLILKPDDYGRIEIENELLQGRQHIHVCAITATNSAAQERSFEETPLEPQDLRLVLGLDPAKRFARKKEVSLVKQGQTFDITDAATGDFEIYDNLSDVYRLFSTLSNDSNLAEFRFVLDWNEKKIDEKLATYSKYACHELNFFLYKKDPEFFGSVVKPYIANKKDKTFLDYWLLDSDVSLFADPWAFNQLNTVERILLSQALGNEPQFTSRNIRESYDLSPILQSRFDQLFGFAVQGNALETESGDLNGKLGLVRDEMISDAKQKSAFLGSAAPNSPSAAGGGRSSGRRGQAEAITGGIDGRALQANKSKDRSTSMGEKKSGLKGKSEDKLFYKGEFQRKRQAVQQLFRQADTTQEWAENNYYKLLIAQQDKNLVGVNRFWRDYSTHPEDVPFYSVHVAEASRNFTEMMFAISVLDLQWKKGKHDTETKDNKLTLTAGSPLLMYHDQIRPAKDGRKETSVLVSQNFFDLKNRYRYDGADRIDNFITDEFVKRSAYGCQVVVTNPTSAKQKIDLLLQIPRGSLPLKGTRATRSLHLELDPYRTSSVEYWFYFPESGEYEHYPVNVARNEEVIAFAEAMKFHVVDQPSKVDKLSWDYISQNGTDQEVLDYLAAHNLQRTDLKRVAWRLHEKAMFSRVVDYLGKNHVFEPVLWAYSVKHDVVGNIRQYLNFNDGFVNQTGSFIDCELLTNDRVWRRTYEHLEYEPLINARAHQLGQQRHILNNRFHEQYHRLLWMAGCRKNLGNQELLGLTYYMILQDRLSEAKEFFERISVDTLVSRLQYDYMAAYLDMLNTDPKIARALVTKYNKYPVDRWRNVFLEIGNQLNELDGKGTDLVDNENRENVQDNLAIQTPSFDFKVDSKQIEINYQNVERVQVNYYVMDVELLFSRNPFVQQFSGELTYIRPKKSVWIDLPNAAGVHKWDLPKELDRSNVLVEISGGQQLKSQAYYAHAMNIQMIESYGQLKVVDAKTGRQVPKTYCKVYAQMKDGNVRFYKDGYTDLRGRFDYTSLSTNDLDNVERFSVLVMNDTLGASVREAIPPKR